LRHVDESKSVCGILLGELTALPRPIAVFGRRGRGKKWKGLGRRTRKGKGEDEGNLIGGGLASLLLGRRDTPE